MDILGGILRKDAVTTTQAARILGMQRASIIQLISKGKLRSYGKLCGIGMVDYHILSEADVRAYRPKTRRPAPFPNDMREYLGDPDLMTTKEAAKLLELKPHSVRGLIYRGELSAQRIRLKRDAKPSLILSRREVEKYAEARRYKPPPGWLTVREAALHLGLSEGWVHRLAASGRLPCKRVVRPGYSGGVYQVLVKPELREPPSQLSARRAFYERETLYP